MLHESEAGFERIVLHEEAGPDPGNVHLQVGSAKINHDNQVALVPVLGHSDELGVACDVVSKRRLRRDVGVSHSLEPLTNDVDCARYYLREVQIEGLEVKKTEPGPAGGWLDRVRNCAPAPDDLGPMEKDDPTHENE